MNQGRARNKVVVNLLFSQLTTLAVTIQTGILINQNHEAAGGQPPPQIYSQFNKLFNVLSLDVNILPLGCLETGVSYWMILLFQTLGTLAVLLCLTVAWSNIWLPCWKQAEGDGTSLALVRRDRFATYGILFVKLVLPAVSLEILQAFACRSYDYGDDEEDKRYLVVDYSVNCSSPFYKFLSSYAAVMCIIFPFGMPFLALLGLYRLRRHKIKQNEDTSVDDQVLLDADAADDGGEVTNGGTAIPERESPFATLSFDVKPAFWFMEVVDMFRRLALTCLPIVFSNYGAVVVFSLCITLLGLVVQYELKPYKLDLMNTTKTIEAWQNLLCVVVLLIQDANMFQSPTLYDTAGVVLILIDVLMIIIMLQNAFKRGALQVFSRDVFIKTERSLPAPPGLDYGYLPLMDEETPKEDLLASVGAADADRASGTMSMWDAPYGLDPDEMLRPRDNTRNGDDHDERNTGAEAAVMAPAAATIEEGEEEEEEGGVMSTLPTVPTNSQ